jgi:hypothetical protein
MTTDIDDRIFILETVDIRLPEPQQTTKFDYMNSSQLYFMIDDYIDITCEEVAEFVFGEKLNIRNNLEYVYEQIHDLNNNQMFDAELVGPDGETVIGKMTIARVE